MAHSLLSVGLVLWRFLQGVWNFLQALRIILNALQIFQGLVAAKKSSAVTSLRSLRKNAISFPATKSWA